MLTTTTVRKAITGLKPYRLTDGLGLYLLVTPAGGKLWRYKYRFQGSQKEMSYGGFPAISLDVARSRHAAARSLLGKGEDPMATRKTERLKRQASTADSFNVVSRLWLEHWAVDKSIRHVDTTRRRLEANVYPMLSARPITEIAPAELVQMVKAIEKRGVGDLAKRALETCGQIFRYAIAHGYCARNPAAQIKPSDVLRPVRKEHLARIDARELPGLLRAIEVYRGHVVTRLAVKLMALTFVRTGELVGARWAEFDIPGRRWNIPAHRMKMKTPHIVPLATQVLELLQLLYGITGTGELLFPGDRNQERPMSNNTILFALRRMGYGGIMTGHGFRGLASTILHEQAFDHEWIELQLAHTPRNAVSAAYNHALYLEPRGGMMQAWANFLEKTQRLGTIGSTV